MAELTFGDYQARVDVIREATYQIDKLVEALLNAALSPEMIEIEWLVRGVAPRLHQLNNAIMSATNIDETIDHARSDLTS